MWQESSPTVKQPPHDYMFREVTVREPGFAYVFVSPAKGGISSSDYFAFGLQHTTGERAGVYEQRYLYNGKELQDELNMRWLDYGARMYMPEIGRWNGIDASAMNYVNQSVYHYAGNNPINFVDYDGNDYGVKIDREKKTITIVAQFLVSSRNLKAFNERGRDKWNEQGNGKFVFVAGGVKALKAGKADVYKINIEVSYRVLNGERYASDGRVIESYTPRDETARADNTGTLNSFDTVKEIPGPQTEVNLEGK